MSITGELPPMEPEQLKMTTHQTESGQRHDNASLQISRVSLFTGYIFIEGIKFSSC